MKVLVLLLLSLDLFRFSFAKVAPVKIANCSGCQSTLCFGFNSDKYFNSTTRLGIDSIPAPVITANICNGELSKIWDKRFGGSSNDVLNSMVLTSDGGYLLGGTILSGISGDISQASRGEDDYWIVKTDANGNKQWDKRFGGSGIDGFQSVVASSDGGYLLGGWSNSGMSGDKTQPSQGTGADYWVVKIDAYGNKLWDKRFGGSSNDALITMIGTLDGGYLMGGYSESGISGDKTQASKGGFDYWVVKIDAYGNKLWDKTFGGSGDEIIYSLISTIDGGYLLGGWSASGVSGDKSQPSQGWTDFWAIKTDSYGNKVWDKGFGGRIMDAITAMVASNDGGYLLAGQSESEMSGDKSQSSLAFSNDYWVVKIDGNGNKLWDKTFGGTSNDNLFTVVLLNDGGYLLGGNSSSNISGSKTQPSQGSSDYWIVKIDANGTKMWDKGFGGSKNEKLLTILSTSDGGYVLGGFSSSDISGDKTQNSQGAGDYWLVKTTSCQPVANLCAGQNYTLMASGCDGTVFWSTGLIGKSITIDNFSFAQTYTATCFVNNAMSGSSNSIVVAPLTNYLTGTADNKVERAVQNITSTQTIPLDVTMTYQAGNSIVLQGTFYAQTGSIFKAEIKGCN